MRNIAIDILPLLLLILIIVGIKPVKSLTYIHEDYMSVESLRNYKGILAISVIFHHLSQDNPSGFIFRKFRLIGYLLVAMFFFYSGYGLQKSYMNKKDKYTKEFLKKRVPTILIPYAIVTIIYWIFNCIIGRYYSFKNVIYSFVKGDLIVTYSWYVITILIFYLSYWILMKICKENYCAMIIGGIIWNAIYMYFCMKLSFGQWWYNTSHLLVVGMIWAIYEDKLNEIIKKHFAIIPMFWISFLILFYIKTKFVHQIPIYKIGLIFEMIISILFVISVILFSTRIKIGNKVLAFLGDISFEIYLIHGLFINLFRSNIIYFDNQFVFTLMVIAMAIIIGYLLHIIFRRILAKYKMLIKA